MVQVLLLRGRISIDRSSDESTFTNPIRTQPPNHGHVTDVAKVKVYGSTVYKEHEKNMKKKKTGENAKDTSDGSEDTFLIEFTRDRRRYQEQGLGTRLRLSCLQEAQLARKFQP